jgi:hypothetical protein
MKARSYSQCRLLPLSVAVALFTAAGWSATATGQVGGSRKASGPSVGKKAPATKPPPTTQPAGKQATDSKPKQSTATRAKKKPGCGDATPAEVEAAERATRAKQAGAAKAGADADGGPRFAVDKEIDTAESIWMGSSAKFSFTIRNEGDADLNIKAKGG